VISDILVFQRRSPAISWHGESWMESGFEMVPGIKTNEYWEKYPGQIVGTPMLDKHGMYQRNDIKIVPPNDIQWALDRAVDQLVEQVLRESMGYVPVPDYTAISDDVVHLR